MKKQKVTDAMRLVVYALTLVGAAAGSIFAAFEILPEGRMLRIVLLCIACVCVVCNVWLKWQDVVESGRKTKRIDELCGSLDRQSLMMKTLMANSVPSSQTLRLVQGRFAKLLASDGWEKFSVVDFESPEERIKAFVVKNEYGGVERLMWLNSDEVNLLASVCNGVEFDDVARSLLCKGGLEKGRSIADVWNQLSDVIMPVMLFSYDVSDLRYDAENYRLYLPLPMAEVEKMHGKTNTMIADYSGKPCVWACFERQFLESIIGQTRVEVSQRVIGKISEIMS